MVWAIPRIAPTVAYMLFEAHPAKRRGYRLRLKIKINKIAECLNSTPLAPVGLIPQTKRANINASPGATKKTLFLPLGSTPSFMNSFTASAMGWRIPPTDTLLGPFRDCLSPKILRSNKVKKATLIRTGTITTTKLSNLKIITFLLHSFNVIL